MKALALAIAALLWPGDAKELLANGGFEKDLESWRPLDMSKGTAFEIDTKVKHTGKQALRIEKKASGKPDFLKASIDLPARSGKLVLSIATLAAQGGSGRVDAYFFDAQGATIGQGFMTLATAKFGQKFESARAEYDIPEGAKGFGINVIVDRPGTVWIDSASVMLAGDTQEKPKRRAGGNLLEDGGFEAGIDAWTDVTLGSGTASATRSTAAKATGTGALVVERKSNRLFPEDGVQTKVAEPGASKRFQLALKARAEAGVTWRATVLAFDTRGICIGSTRTSGTASNSFTNAQCMLELKAACDHLIVVLAARGTGSAWFDDVVLEAK